jgi:hypothetical protein
MPGFSGSDRNDTVVYRDDAGDVVQIQIQSDGMVPISPRRPIGVLADVFSPVQQVASALIASVREAQVQPDEVSVSFGISVDATGEAIVSRKESDGTFAVTLTWRASAPGAAREV